MSLCDGHHWVSQLVRNCQLKYIKSALLFLIIIAIVFLPTQVFLSSYWRNVFQITAKKWVAISGSIICSIALITFHGVSQRAGIEAADHSKRVVMLSYCRPPKVVWRSPILSWPRIMFSMFSNPGWHDGTTLEFCPIVFTEWHLCPKNVIFSKNRHWNVKVSLQGIYYKSYKGAFAQSTTCTTWYFFLHEKEKSSRVTLALHEPWQD